MTKRFRLYLPQVVLHPLEDHDGPSCGLRQTLIRIWITFKIVLLPADVWARADPRNKVVVSLSPQGFLGGLQCCL